MISTWSRVEGKKQLLKLNLNVFNDKIIKLEGIFRGNFSGNHILNALNRTNLFSSANYSSNPTPEG